VNKSPAIKSKNLGEENKKINQRYKFNLDDSIKKGSDEKGMELGRNTQR
jgi:hypothetical protein